MSSPNSDTDATPLRLDDAEALTEAYRTYRTALTRYALGLTGSKAEAHDVVQDVFVKLWSAATPSPSSGRSRPFSTP